MSNILGHDIVDAIRQFDPATDQVARGVDHYVQQAGGKMDKLFGLVPKPVPEAVSEVSASPPVMPTPDDEMMQLAKRRSLTEMMRRRGRASTILTDADALGG